MEEQIPHTESTPMASLASPVPVQPAPITIEQAQTTARRQKARNRRNVWKDQTGSSVFELDGAHHAKLVCGEANVPLSALPGKAKFVVRQYQYEKRDKEARQSFDSENEDFSDEEFSDEEGYYVRKTEDNAQNVSLGEFLGNQAPDASTWVRLAKESLALLRSTPVNAIAALQNCQHVRENVMRLIETDSTLSDEIMAELLGQLEELNSIL